MKLNEGNKRKLVHTIRSMRWPLAIAESDVIDDDADDDDDGTDLKKTF